MNQEFIEFINALMAAAPDVVNEKMTDDVKQYLSALMETNDEKPDLTDSGKLVLKFLQENVSVATWKARDIAEGLFVSSRVISGTMRKLANDGFVEKLGKDPVIYTLTEKGKDYKIED